MEISIINISQGLQEFIHGLRIEIVSLFEKKFGNQWPKKFRESLSPDQQVTWDKSIKNGKSPEKVIDFQYLSNFSAKYKILLWPQFDKKTTHLPIWFEDIALVRNNVNHYTTDDITQDDIDKAWIHMITIARTLRMKDIEKSLNVLRKRRKITGEEIKDFENEIHQDQPEEDANNEIEISEPKQNSDPVIVDNGRGEKAKVYKENEKTSNKEAEFDFEASFAKIMGRVEKIEALDVKIKELEEAIAIEEKRTTDEISPETADFVVLDYENGKKEAAAWAKFRGGLDKLKAYKAELIKKQEEEKRAAQEKPTDVKLETKASEPENNKGETMLFKRITKDLDSDFKMIHNLKWIKIKNKKIIILYNLGKIVLDFDNQTIYEQFYFQRKRILNYKKIIDTFLEEEEFTCISLPNYDHKDPRYPYSSYQSYQSEVKLLSSLGTNYERKRNTILKLSLNHLSFSLFEMVFEIGNQKSNQKYSCIIREDLNKSQIQNIYLFYSYIASYICRDMNVNLIINRTELNTVGTDLSLQIDMVITIYDFYLSDVDLGPNSSSHRYDKLNNIQ
jgi:hypothetical protein